MPQEPKEIRDYETVLADDLRPNGDKEHCFYCKAILGSPHAPICTIRKCAGSYTVAIRDNKRGTVRHYRHDMEWNDGAMFLWTEGNYSCDCNRHLFFLEADGRPIPDDDRPCGDVAYSALYAELPNGDRIPLDDTPA